MSLKKALLAATVLALPLSAQAQPVSGFYVGAGAGIDFLMEADVSISDIGGPGGLNGSVSFDPGFVGVISLGYGFGNGVRAEIEGNYRQGSADKVSGTTGLVGPGAGSAPISGTARSYGVMANALYDFDIGSEWGFTPYVGVGLGYIWRQASDIGGEAQGSFARVDGTDGRFAYQAIIGASIPLNEVAPGLALTAEYRFLGSLSQELDFSAGVGGQTYARGSVDVDNNYNHSLLIGLRYAFGAAPAPAPVVAPAPAAAPAPARTYLVFFDFDRANLTDRARQIIAEAAQNAQRAGTTRIEVAGHADRAGTPQYNQRLSERRAQAVAAELERRGVARSAMTIQAFGETRPLVPTADGVREPQNRRVEIVLR